MADRFTWRDGERLIRFAAGAADEVPELLAGAGFDDYLLLTTARARRAAPGLAERAAQVLHVPPGKVDEISAQRLPDAAGRPLVALGGGRVIDTAKALAGAREGGRCAAVPTTLSGAEMTPFHRTPRGVDGARLVRPELVVADPELMASQPLTSLAASAMNALAHALEALITPLANPVGSMAALRAAELIGSALPRDEPDRPALALAAVHAGYASGCAGIAVHHAVCQTIVRSCGSPHAETNAVMLPHSARLLGSRAPGPLARFARALGDPGADPESAPGDIARLAARCGHTRLSTLGVEADQLPAVAAAVQSHRAIGMTPDPPEQDELLELLRGAL